MDDRRSYRTAVTTTFPNPNPVPLPILSRIGPHGRGQRSLLAGHHSMIDTVFRIGGHTEPGPASTQIAGCGSERTGQRPGRRRRSPRDPRDSSTSALPTSGVTDGTSG